MTSDREAALFRDFEAATAEKNRLRKVLEDIAKACEAPPMSENEECYAIVKKFAST